MNVLVVGAGAVGSLFGARLHAAGHAVTLVGRTDHVRAIQAHGLVVEGIRPCRQSLPAVDRLPVDGPWHAVLLGVKAYDVAATSEAVARAIPGPLPTLLPQNGLGIEELARVHLERGGWLDRADPIVRMVHSVPATLVGPGRVRQAGDGVLLLPAPTVPSRAALETWAELAGSMGYPVHRPADFDREVWRKALLNAAINPVTADHGILNGRLRDDPWRGQALRLLEEAARVADAEGHRFDRAELEGDLWRVVRATATNRSSMLQDVDRGRRTEIEEISGQLLRLGESHGLDLPATRRVIGRFRRRSRDAVGSARPVGPAQPS